MKLYLAIAVLLLAGTRALAQDAETLGRAAVYEPLMLEAGARYGVDPRLLWTVAFLESRFQCDAVSDAGARGMMQFMPATAMRFRLSDPHDPEASIVAAARYLRQLQQMFDHRLDLILAAYNAGEGAVMAFREGRRLILSNGKVINPHGLRTGGVPPYRETIDYVNNGVALYLKLAEGTKFQSSLRLVKLSRLRAPQQQPDSEADEGIPEEITRLKQGSIYIVSIDDPKPNAASQLQTHQQNETPSITEKSTSRSIYVK